MNEHINLPTHTQAMPFSDAVWAGDLLYLSGRIGVIPGTRKLPREATEEARLLLDGVRDVLAAANLTMDDLVFVQVSTPDVSLYDVFNGVYTKYFKGPLPARAFLGSGPLLSGARFELWGIAKKQ